MKNFLSTLTLASLLTLGACGDSQTSAEHLQQARDHLANSNYEAAIIELKNAVQKDNSSGEARFMLGELQLRAGATAAAEKELRAARDLGWSEEQVTPALAKALLAERKFAQIRELSLEGLSPAARAEVLTVQSVSELAQGETDAAAELIAEAEAAAPDSTAVMIGAARVSASQRNLGQAEAILERALKADPESAPAWHLLGDIKLNEGDTTAALEAYNKTLSIQPENFQARLRRSLVAMTKGDFETAASDAESLMKMAPRNPASNYVNGLVLFEAEDYPDAISSLTQAEPAFRQFPMVLYYLASAHLTEGNDELAGSFAERFVGVAPNNVAGRKLLATLRLQDGDYRDVQSLISPVLDSNPNDIGALNLMANALIRDGKTDQGITMLSRLAELQPDSAQAQVRLGAGLLITGDSDEAIQHIETALELDPEFQQADILLVLNHLRKGEYDEAIAAARAYAGRNPVSVTPHNLLGRVYLQAGLEAEARESFATALRIDKGDIGANHNLALLALEKDDLDAARGYYQAVIAEHPDSMPAVVQLAKLEARAQNEEAMVGWLIKATEAQPEALEPKLMLARYYLSQGKAAQVAPLFSTLEAVQQRSPEVLRVLALSQLAEKNPLEARRTLEELLETTPDTAATRHLMAQAAIGTGDLNRARQDLQSSLQLDENYFPARIALARLELLEDNNAAFEEQLQWLLENAPEDNSVLQIQAQNAARQQQPDAAVSFARQAYSQTSSQKNLLILAGYEDAAGNTDAGVTLMQAWLKDNPDDGAVRLALGMALGQRGSTADSLVEYKRVLDADPNNFAALNNLAWEVRQSDPETSVEYARRALQVAPDSAAALDTLAMAEFYNEDFKAAQRSIRRALEGAPGQPSMLYHAAMIDKALGNSALAKRNLERLLEQHDEFPERAEAEALLDSLE